MYSLIGHSYDANHVVDWSDLKVDVLTNSELEEALMSDFKIAGCSWSNNTLKDRVRFLRDGSFEASLVKTGNEQYGVATGYYNRKGDVEVDTFICMLFDIHTGKAIALLANEPIYEFEVGVFDDDFFYQKEVDTTKKLLSIETCSEVPDGVVFNVKICTKDRSLYSSNLYMIDVKEGTVEYLASTAWTFNKKRNKLPWSLSKYQGDKVILDYVDKHGSRRALSI